MLKYKVILNIILLKGVIIWIKPSVFIYVFSILNRDIESRLEYIRIILYLCKYGVYDIYKYYIQTTKKTAKNIMNTCYIAICPHPLKFRWR